MSFPRSALCSDDARTVTDNLTEAMRFFGRARQDGEVHDLPGVSVIYCGLNYAAFNAAVLSEPVGGDSRVLRQRIRQAGDYFEHRKLRWSCWYCEDYVGKPLLRLARSLFEEHGMSELTEAPGMITDRLAEPSRLLPPLEIRPVSDAATRSAFAHVTSITFEVPWTICREVYGAERAWQGSFRGFVGYTSGAAVSTTAVVVAAGVAGIYSVGTLPSYRNRGYAEALMRQALLRIRNETGIERTALQSTRSGIGLYRKMGYRPVTKYTVFMTE